MYQIKNRRYQTWKDVQTGINAARGTTFLAGNLSRVDIEKDSDRVCSLDEYFGAQSFVGKGSAPSLSDITEYQAILEYSNTDTHTGHGRPPTGATEMTRRGNPDPHEMVHMMVTRKRPDGRIDEPLCNTGAYNIRYTRVSANVTCPKCKQRETST